jgi:hypothetical protein
MEMATQAASRSLTALACWLVLSLAPACAAEIRVEGSAIRITGRIEPGDAQKLQDLLATPKGSGAFARSGTFLLDSKGGGVSEALKIAHIVERGFGTTVVPSGAQCYSACFLVYAAGSYRIAGQAAALGVHQLAMAKGPAQDPADLAALDRVSAVVDAYLKSRGVPPQVIDKMKRTPPHDMFMFGNRWLLDQGIEGEMTRHPDFMAVVDQHCGSEPRDEARHRQWLDCMAGVRSRSLVAAR